MGPFRELIKRGVTLDGPEHVHAYPLGTTCFECGRPVRDDLEADTFRGAVLCRACLCCDHDHEDVVERATAAPSRLARCAELVPEPARKREVLEILGASS